MTGNVSPVWQSYPNDSNAVRRPPMPPRNHQTQLSNQQTKRNTMSCQGKTKNGQGGIHGQGVYKCKICGMVGCDSNDCTNRNFYAGQCLKCGKSISGRERVA